ncbi:uncharacterized protein Z520_01480 [Fonsecaea multimorphosa CBS 102226]|uniref:Uncharacterized protein n=1 Tax=Fonsecaea multimorphosa CBS 102226 TaxID=1442371 RepID=A0A0D2L1T5_9EURO|nr:uncharacterized protein Z520_01480 [Fonsecaea multimorphosa CBS 102226]KIY03014.1 hypothetical protein Z520_01480 [Fonsecaea multimorphosa CBS 102226]OAL30843.1 hypothetical protein AYO22_01463 [Fonsecaea multimorphosa]
MSESQEQDPTSNRRSHTRVEITHISRSPSVSSSVADLHENGVQVSGGVSPQYSVLEPVFEDPERSVTESGGSVDEFPTKHEGDKSAYSTGNTDTDQSRRPHAQPGYAWTVADSAAPSSYPYRPVPPVYSRASPYPYPPYMPPYSTVPPGYGNPYGPAIVNHTPPKSILYPAAAAPSSAPGHVVGPSQDEPDPTAKETPNRGSTRDTLLENFTSEANLKFENELRQTFRAEGQPRELFRKILEAHRIKEAKKAKLLQADAADRKQQPTQVPPVETANTHAAAQPQVGNQGPKDSNDATTVPGPAYPYPPMHPPTSDPTAPSPVPGYIYPQYPPLYPPQYPLQYPPQYPPQYRPQYPPQQPWSGYPYPTPPFVRPPYAPWPQASPLHHTADKPPTAEPPVKETLSEEEALKREREEQEMKRERAMEAAMAAAARAEETTRAREEGHRAATVAAEAEAAQAKREQRVAEQARADAKLAAAAEAAVVADRQELMYVKALRLFEERERYALDFADRERRLYREALRNGLQIGASGGRGGRSSTLEQLVARDLVAVLTKRAEVGWQSDEEEGDHVDGDGDSDSEPYQRIPARRGKLDKWHPKLRRGTAETLKTSAPSIPLAPELPEPGNPDELDRGILADESARSAEHS